MKRAIAVLSFSLYWSMPTTLFAQMHLVHIVAACGFAAGTTRSDYNCLDNPTVGLEPRLQKMIRFNGTPGVGVKIEDCPGVALPIIARKTDGNLVILIDGSTARGLGKWFLTAMLAHEMAHVIDQDMYHLPCVTRQHELDADRYAGFWSQTAGCPKVDSITAAFLKVPADQFHPPPAQRIDSVRAGWDDAMNRTYAVLWHNADPSLTGILANTSLRYSEVSITAFPYANRIIPAAVIRNWEQSKLINSYDRCLDVYATITPHISITDHKKSKDYTIKLHLTSTSILRPLNLILPQITEVSYSFDKSNLLHPVVVSYNQNHDDFGYTVTGIWPIITVNCVIYFKDGSSLPLTKSFHVN